jgi:hypothetical protein
MPIHGWIELPTEWWAELRIEVPSKVTSEMPIQLPSPEFSAGSGSESGPEQTGECGTDYRWHSRGLLNLK